MRATASGAKRWPVAAVCCESSSRTSGSVKEARVVASAVMLKGETVPSQETGAPSSCASTKSRTLRWPTSATLCGKGVSSRSMYPSRSCVRNETMASPTRQSASSKSSTSGRGDRRARSWR